MRKEEEGRSKNDSREGGKGENAKKVRERKEWRKEGREEERKDQLRIDGRKKGIKEERKEMGLGKTTKPRSH